MVGTALAAVLAALPKMTRAQIVLAESGNNVVGEYKFSGAPVNPALVSGLDHPTAITVSGSDIYVAEAGDDLVGEYTLSHGDLVTGSLISGLDDPTALAVSGDNLYLADAGNGVVGEYKVSGSTVNPSLISGLDDPTGIAIGSASEAGSTLALLGLSLLGLFCLAPIAGMGGRQPRSFPGQPG